MRAKKQTGVGLLNNVEDWRSRAKEIRVIAETILEGASRQALLQIANDWEEMTETAEGRLTKEASAGTRVGK
jgi:hypothetical protein